MTIEEANLEIEKAMLNPNPSEEEKARLSKMILNNPIAFRVAFSGAISSNNMNLVVQMMQEDNVNRWYEKGSNQTITNDQHLS